MHRKLLDDKWDGLSFFAKGLLLHLIMMANYEDGETFRRHDKLILVKRGQLLTSDAELAKRGNVDRKTIRRCLTNLENLQTIEIKRDTIGSIITICNYDKYQCLNNDEWTTVTTTPGATVTTTVGTRIQECKEIKNLKKGTRIPSDAVPVKEFIALYCEVYNQRYSCNPLITGRVAGIAKRLVNDLGLPEATKLIRGYLEIGMDPWITSSKHSLTVLENNIDAVNVYCKTGKYLTRQDAQQRERKLLSLHA